MEVNHVIPKKATTVAETSTVISTVSRLFFGEGLLHVRPWSSKENLLRSLRQVFVGQLPFLSPKLSPSND